MYKLLAIFLFASVIGGDPGYLKDANEQYKKRNYKKSLIAFAKAEKQLPGMANIIEYNIGQCYLEMDDKRAASEAYRNALDLVNDPLTSKALNNIGILQMHEEIDSMAANNNRVDFEPALQSLRDALRDNPENETARYNYEMLKKLYEMLKQKQQEQQQPQQGGMMVVEPPPDMDPPPGQNNQPPPQNMLPPENSTGEYGELSIDEARKKLEEMKGKEQQFLQQLRKKQRDEKKKKRDRDW